MPAVSCREVEQVALRRVDSFEVDPVTVDGGQRQRGRGQQEPAGNVKGEVEAVAERAVGGRGQFVDDVGDGMVLWPRPPWPGPGRSRW